MILFLVKVFEDKKHADDLLRGRLFVNRCRISRTLKIMTGEETKMKVLSRFYLPTIWLSL